MEEKSPFEIVIEYKRAKDREIGRINREIAALTEKYPHADKKISDGHHTFGLLYDYRMAYNALLFNEWAKTGQYGVCKSKKHHDGEPCFGGTHFIVCAQLPTGQVTNHYKLEYWEAFTISEVELAPEWDGHTPEEAKDRLLRMLPGEFGGYVLDMKKATLLKLEDLEEEEE